ncbi:MAG TPA: hypothetical protein PKE45_08520 [Caldilineaceae bacterium]|nr:hypothetical protein [Caldilineaceae bacterium]
MNVDAPALASAPARQEIRFYRRTDAGWLRTEPDAALWGAERGLETPYFIYYFRQNDAQAIVAVAPQIDALYTTLRRNFGLPVSPAGLPGSFADDKLVIEVSVSQSPGTIRFQPHHYAERFVWPDRWVVASPAVYLAPVELTDADLLMQSLALPLLTDGLRQASQRYAIGAAWQPLLEGLSLWQEWELNLPLSAWHDEVVRWQYTEWPPTRPGQRVVLPEHYSDLCARTKLWLSSPLEMNLPLVCAAQRWEYQYLAPWSVTDPLTRLDQLAASDSFVRPSPRQPGETVALATLIEYAVATYGRERLPALVVSLGQYDRWETLIPAVYGVSAAEFEAGWQAYLAAHYGVAPLLSQQATQAQ